MSQPPADQLDEFEIDQSMTFENALARLEQIVTLLEKQDAPLDESIQLYQEGLALKLFCEKRLEQAKMTIETITPDPVSASRG